MTNAQVTLVQLDNYGPWTVTPEPRREADLQTMQSRLFADLSQFVGTREGYVFFTRFDNMIAVTNGMDREDHARLQESIRNRYPVTVSLGVGTGANPTDALVDATAHLQAAGSAQDADRREVLAGQPLDDAERTDEDVRIAHFDVNDATGKYTDELDAFSTFVRIEQGYASLMRALHDDHGGLAFFVGGDNVIALTPGLAERDYRDVIGRVRDEADMSLKVGVGSGATATDAGMAAKHALEI
ncbi:MAG: GTP cyclohydrolase III, partial [Halarchaeum sp.]